MNEPGSSRTIRSSLQFDSPFQLGNYGETFPAGRYDVLTTEAVHEGNDRTVYQRTSTVMIVVDGGTTRYCEVAPADLDAAIGHVRQRGVISAVALGHRQAAFAVMCSG